MPEYLSPGVYVEEFDSGPSPMQGVGTSTAGFVGAAEKGPVIGAPVLVTGPADFNRKFGGYLHASEFGEYRYLAYAVNHFFANGGGRAFIMRVAPDDSATAAIDGNEGLIKIKAKNPGEWGNIINVSFEATNENKSQILKDLGEGKYRLKNAIGFDVGDVVVLENGENRQYNIIKSTTGNTLTMAKPFEGEVADENLLPKIFIKTCEINVQVEHDGTVEKYENVSFNVASPSFIDKKLVISEIVDIESQASSDETAPIEFVRKAFAGEGNKISVTLKGGANGSAASLNDGSFIGKDEGPGSRTGIQAFLDNTDVNIMAVPGVVTANVQLSLVLHCEKLASRFAVLDVPKNAKTVTDIMKHRDIVDSDYCAMYHPWLQVYDPLDKKDTFIPPSGSAIGIYARSDNSRGVHKAPANEVVANCTGLYVNYNVGEQDLLNPKGVNLIRKFPGAGIRVWGARTASSKPLWKYINVRRLFIFLEESIKANTNWVVFEPNDANLWSRVRRTIEIFLEGVWRTGALVGGSPGDAFFVDIGPNTMTKDDIDNGRMICVIGVAPVKPAEFVIFRITQKTGE
jgi:phage tail sheath protein FI